MLNLLPMTAQSFPLAGGDAGVNQTVRAMQRLIEKGKRDPDIHSLAAQILTQAAVPSFDRAGAARAIGEWVRDNIRFTDDVVGIETLHSAREVARLRIGDCDDFTILISSLLQTVGLPTHIVTVAGSGDDPTQFSHVYPEVEIDGQWIAVDYARRDPDFGRTPEGYFRKRVYEEAGRYADVAGLAGMGGRRRRSRSGVAYFPNALPGAYSAVNLNKYRHQLRGRAPSGFGHYGQRALGRLGQDETVQDIASILTASAPDITAATSGAANIIRAENTSLYPYAGIGVGAAALPAGYTVNSAGQVVPGVAGISSSTLLLAGAALLAVLFVSREGQ